MEISGSAPSRSSQQLLQATQRTRWGFVADPADIELCWDQLDRPAYRSWRGFGPLVPPHVSNVWLIWRNPRPLHYSRDVPCIEQIMARSRRMPFRPAYAARSSVPTPHLLHGELLHMQLQVHISSTLVSWIASISTCPRILSKLAVYA
jgi:hypothetical protein